MSVLNLKHLCVRASSCSVSLSVETTHYLVKDIFGVFTAVTAADGFKTLLSHLGPDPKVCN